MPSERPSRRSLLRAGVGATASLAGAGAGCVELLPPLGRRVRYGRVDAPEGTDPTYRRWIPAASALPPQVTWGVEETDDALVVRHEAGEAVPADRLSLEANWDEPLDRQFADEYDVVAPGAAIDVPTDALGSDRLVLFWNSPDTRDTAILLEYDPP